MSAVAKFINNIISIPIVSDILTLFGKFIDSELEFIMGLFGIEEKDVISTQLTSQRMLDDATVCSLVTRCAIEEKRDPGEGILTRLMAYSKTTGGMYKKYYNYGDTTFIDGLPGTNVRSLVVDNDVVKSTIDTAYGINCTILESKLGTTDKVSFVSFRLQEEYGYKPYNNTMLYNGYIYKVSTIDYNYDTDRYDVTIKSYENRTTVITTTTTITVTNINTTTDNKHTVVSRHTVVTGTVQGVISDVTEIISTTDETVPKGSVTDSVTTPTETITINDVVWSTVVISTVAYNATRYYTVKYWYVNNTQWYYWVYENGSGTYPILDGITKYITNLEMLPVVTIRNGTVNTNADKNSVRYLQSKAILSYIGLDIETITDTISQNPGIANVEDCFIHFGLRPQDSSNIVSKALYALFDFLYDSDLADGGTYMATFTEDPFNAALKWTNQTRTAVNGVIGSLNYVTHSVSGTTLTIRKQVAPEQYVQMVIDGLAIASFIDRGGLTGAVEIPLGNDYFSIPLSYFFISKLSSFDQYELFNKTLLITLYSAQVTHLDWYETPEFASFLKIVGIVLTVVSFGAYAYVYGFVAALTMAAIGMVIVIGATLLLKMIMRSTDNKFIQGLAAVLYIAAMVYGASYGMPMDASQLVQMVTYFGTALSATGTALGIYTGIQSAALGAERNVYEQKLQSAFDEIENRKEDFNSMFTTQEVAGMMTMQTSQPYLFGVDAQMYKAIQAQYSYDVLYDYDSLISEYYTRNKMLGVI